MSFRTQVSRHAIRTACLIGLALLTRGIRAEDLCPEEKAAGFVSIFDGKTFTGWTGATSGYEIVDGTIRCIPGQGGNLLTEKDYADFILRVEFKLTPGGNNGIGIRAPEKGHVATEGIEIQILDNTAEKYNAIAPYQFHGSVYGLIPSKREYTPKVNEWNQQEVECVGRKIAIRLNGVEIVSGDLDEALKNGPMDGREHPGAKRTSGRVGFLGHDDPVAFRHIRIKEITAGQK
jgi:hypothetical protein